MMETQLKRRTFAVKTFVQAEVGHNKAEALAFRLSTAWGIPIRAFLAAFLGERGQSEYDTLTILLGCVDTTKARRSLHQGARATEHQKRCPSMAD
jgi:hypothetical protein